MIGLRDEPRKCGNDWTWGIFGEGEEPRREERENSPREHGKFSQIIARTYLINSFGVAQTLEKKAILRRPKHL
jgi:hypothetical protein